MASSKLFTDILVTPTAQTALIEFSDVPDDGYFRVQLGDVTTDNMDFDMDASDLQGLIRDLSLAAGDPISMVTVTGDFTAGFTIVAPNVPGPISVPLSTLEASASPVDVTVTFTNEYVLDISTWANAAIVVSWGELDAPADLSLSSSGDAITFQEIEDSVVAMDEDGGSEMFNCGGFFFKYLKINVPADMTTSLEVRLQSNRFGV